MRAWLIALLIMSTTMVAAQDWTPPDNPKPTVILREARADRTAGRYADALAKHVWYHDNALQIQPSQTGVRLSFALSDWMRLGKAYPPAMTKLRDICDQTEGRIRDENRNSDYFLDFMDLAALNRELDQQAQTATLFRWLSERNHDAAKEVFGVSQPALIAAGEYKLCGEYLDLPRDVSRIGEHYRMGLESAKRFGPHHLDYVQKRVVKDAATLVALLVQNQRTEEATATVETLKEFVDDPALSEQLVRALESAIDGNIPSP